MRGFRLLVCSPSYLVHYEHAKRLNPVQRYRAIRLLAYFSSSAPADPKHLLSLATAEQLKGDIPSAISIAATALFHHRQKNDNPATADAALFLGKLHQLQKNYLEAEHHYKLALELHRTINLHSREEYNALVHLAHVYHKLHNFAEAERGYVAAAQGLEQVVGWEDGATNRSNFELVKFYEERGRYDEALETLQRMKRGLGIVFGENDYRVLQLNEKMADVLLVISSRQENLKMAMDLLDEISTVLPPNSPEARRAFMRLEDLKEEEQRRRGSEDGFGMVEVSKVFSNK